MRVRKQDVNGDYQFGHGSADFIADSPAVVQLLLQNTLLIFEGEWFLDNTFGTPWYQSIQGYGGNYDMALQGTILGCPGVTGIDNYSSSLVPNSRHLVVTSGVQTQFGSTSVSTTIPVNV